MHPSLQKACLIALLVGTAFVLSIAIAVPHAEAAPIGRGRDHRSRDHSWRTPATTVPPPTTAPALPPTSPAPAPTAAATTPEPPPPTVPPTTSAPAPPPTTQPPAPAVAPAEVFPSAINTGVPSVVVLKPSGSLTITTAGAVVSGLDVNGCLLVRANNVTIKNTRVRQSGPCWGGAIDTEYGAYGGITIQDVEVDGARQNSGAALVSYGGFTCLRCNLHDGGQGFHLASDVLVTDSYVHDLYGTGTTHNDAVLSNGGGRIVVRHSTLICDVGFPGNASTGGGCTGAFNLFGDFSPIDDVVADDNSFVGGSYCVYAGNGYGKPYPVATNVRITNNKFARQSPSWSKCGIYGPYTGFAPNPGNVWSGNVWLDNGQPIA